MRTLVIAGEYPWPENSGSRIRLSSILGGLRRCGPTELFSIVPRGRTEFDPPEEGMGLDRVGRIGFDDRPPSGRARLARLAQTAIPLEFPRQDRRPVAQAVTRFMVGHYDLLWYFGIRPWVLAGGLQVGPDILDFVDLEDEKIAARLAIPRPPAHGLAPGLRQVAGRALSEEEVRRWGRLHRRAGAATTTTVVCSALDAERAERRGVARVAVVPNGYPRVEHPVGRLEVRSPPTILFPGTLRYPPNAEAARFLIGEVRPELSALVPGARLRLVGLSTPALSELDDRPGVAIVGQVPDLGAELARADLVVVPLRFGSGTRLKVLEAFAQRVPVVSTSLGAEGLDAEDGVHLLIGDTPATMAAACARLLADLPLRQRLVDRAHQLFLDRFQNEVVERRVAELARAVAGGQRELSTSST
jgi:glycosyltransferase involved in cell wall biosynthesis